MILATFIGRVRPALTLLPAIALYAVSIPRQTAAQFFAGQVQLIAQNPNSPVGGPDSGIYIMNADGSEPHKLINFKDSRWQGWPQWSHDGKQIAVEVWPANVKGADTRVFVVPAEGGEPKDLGLGKNPSWTSDDKQIVFAIPRGNTSDTKNGTWIMNADGTGRQWLFAGGRASCSPDGGRIAFVNSVEGNDSVYVYDLLTAETKKVLAENYLHVYGTAWSGDGKRICFVGNERNKPIGLAIIDSEGSEKFFKVRLTDNLGHNPNWGPGRKILLWVMVDNVPRLHTIDPDNDVPPTLLGKQTEMQANIDASWSPDGKRIVYSYNPDAGQ